MIAIVLLIWDEKDIEKVETNISLIWSKVSDSKCFSLIRFQKV